MTNPESDIDRTTAGNPQVQDVVSVLLERALATADVATSTLKLAAAEARLAASSAGLLAGILVALAVMLPITWLVALATAFAALQSAGLSPLLSLCILLALQIALCALMAWSIMRLSRLMAFRRTREALRTSTDQFINDKSNTRENIHS